MSLPEKKRNKYTPIRLLGQGSYGKAYLVRENPSNVIILYYYHKSFNLLLQLLILSFIFSVKRLLKQYKYMD